MADFTPEEVIQVVEGGRKCAGADLRDIDLSGADLTLAILSGANLRGADLEWAKLGGAYKKASHTNRTTTQPTQTPSPHTHHHQQLHITTQRNCATKFTSFSDPVGLSRWGCS